ncbi:alpha/beta fold hydrolase [Nocardia wallacei]|uniref:alpha/beta fold hydrolase n=1 Tax=Nocardia wallacei TaxID=480035 RepID=UPI002454CC99|nr:alpha/beta hydrolase [Nocardia wallacei]
MRRTTEFDVTEGTLRHGMPYLAIGSGRPLVFLVWFTPDHATPTGRMRESLLRALAPFARDRRVYAVYRAPGMAVGTTMGEIATQHAEALREEFGEPVDVLGVSSGGSIALQLAADHPDVVRRLVTVCSGYRLDEHTRVAQLRYAEAVANDRRGLHHSAPMLFRSAWQARAAAALLWLVDPFVRPRDPADTLAFVRAEDRFDLTGRLADITAPALIVGGDRDSAYSVENFRHTAAGIPGGRVRVYPRVTHLGAVKDPALVADVRGFLDGKPVGTAASESATHR